ncbi:organic hydroperoxide resistance [Fusarium beomiforme]|uniref:Organic hydroperoxide resistance n=1 Tax=Fusarium beomiforme TaxID=44412 RepID=A0A9P5DQQ0_9HYPO|nr:organic hydroperoxide resistance [Fusarium beomiforme]
MSSLRISQSLRRAALRTSTTPLIRTPLVTRRLASESSSAPESASSDSYPYPKSTGSNDSTGSSRPNHKDLPILYSARAKVVGARKGHVEGENLNVDLTMSKALGGPGDAGKTNPEELFAAGYGACFQSAMNAVAAKEGITMPTSPEDSIVETTVYLIGDMKALDLALRVHMKVMVRGLEKEKLERIAKKARSVCPYSRATRRNVHTEWEIIAMD